MKLKIKENQIKKNIQQFMRSIGYIYIEDRRTGKDSFVRSLAQENYPRFHVYLKNDSDYIIFDLHLDQKQASYAGAHMHNAEYGGEVVAREIHRIKEALNPAPQIDDLEKQQNNTFQKLSDRVQYRGDLFS